MDSAYDPPVTHQDALRGQQFRLPGGGGTAESASCSDHPPPGDVLVRAVQEIAHRPGRTGEPGLFGHLPVGDHLAGPEGAEDFEDGFLESLQSVPKRRSPMSPSPGVM